MSGTIGRMAGITGNEARIMGTLARVSESGADILVCRYPQLNRATL